MIFPLYLIYFMGISYIPCIKFLNYFGILNDDLFLRYAPIDILKRCTYDE